MDIRKVSTNTCLLLRQVKGAAKKPERFDPLILRMPKHLLMKCTALIAYFSHIT